MSTPASFGPPDLRDGAGHVGGQRVGHGLHGDRRAVAHRHAADVDAARLPPGDLLVRPIAHKVALRMLRRGTGPALEWGVRGRAATGDWAGRPAAGRRGCQLAILDQVGVERQVAPHRPVAAQRLGSLRRPPPGPSRRRCRSSAAGSAAPAPPRSRRRAGCGSAAPARPGRAPAPTHRRSPAAGCATGRMAPAGGVTGSRRGRTGRDRRRRRSLGLLRDGRLGRRVAAAEAVGDGCGACGGIACSASGARRIGTCRLVSAGSLPSPDR